MALPQYVLPIWANVYYVDNIDSLNTVPSTSQYINSLYCLFTTHDCWKLKVCVRKLKYLDDDLNNDLSEAMFLGARVGPNRSHRSFSFL